MDAAAPAIMRLAMGMAVRSPPRQLEVEHVAGVDGAQDAHQAT
jgi:hypothetical protein